jgi:methyl-accepting chemotaxis protein
MRQVGGEPATARGLMRRVAHGDLTVSAPDAAAGSLLAELNGTVGALRQTVEQVRATAAGVATASTQLATGGLDLSARSERVASSLEQTAAAMEELSGALGATSVSATRAHQMVSETTAAARNGSTVMREVVATMGRIDDSSSKIAEIIGVIDGIAFQTNILALNAAVEAARAGEQGRGFAVVAAEVRTLAQRSAGAAREIKALINESVERAHAGTELVSRAGQGMDEIVTGVVRVQTIIDEIASSSREQAGAIAQVNQAISDIDRSTQQNAALVEESSAATASMKDQAQALHASMRAFQL